MTVSSFKPPNCKLTTVPYVVLLNLLSFSVHYFTRAYANPEEICNRSCPDMFCRAGSREIKRIIIVNSGNKGNYLWISITNMMLAYTSTFSLATFSQIIFCILFFWQKTQFIFTAALFSLPFCTSLLTV